MKMCSGQTWRLKEQRQAQHDVFGMSQTGVRGKVTAAETCAGVFHEQGAQEGLLEWYKLRYEFLMYVRVQIRRKERRVKHVFILYKQFIRKQWETGRWGFKENY